jgi:hypothetical protein
LFFTRYLDDITIVAKNQNLMENRSFLNIVSINGLFTGLAIMLLYTLFYFGNKDLIFNITLSIISSLVIYVFFMVRSVKQYKEINSGFASFAEALKVTIVVYAIGSFISLAGQYVFSHYIDPGLMEMEIEKAIEVSTDLATTFGAPEDDIIDMKEQLRSEAESQQNRGPITILLDWIVSIIFGLFFCMIVSLFLKGHSKS